MRKTMYYCTEKGKEFSLYLEEEDVQKCYHAGNCDDDCHEVANYPYVKEQLEKLDPKEVEGLLLEYGLHLEQTEEQIAKGVTYEENLFEILIWIAAADIIDGCAEEDKQ